MVPRILLLLTAAVTLVSGAPEYVDRLNDAASVFREIMMTPDNAIPQGLLDRASCIVVVPGLKKVGFLVGAKYGKGYISCRKKNGIGWTAPGTIRVEGGSFGFQIGASETDVVMLVMNSGGKDKLLSSQFTLGAGASVAAGPVGRSTSAQTDALMTAQILSWSRSRGVFAGVSLQGATLRQDLDDNRELYRKPMDNRQIIEQQPAVPKAAKAFIALLDKYSGREVR
jgi:lipid-binding SYLF domain-containing protein